MSISDSEVIENTSAATPWIELCTCTCIFPNICIPIQPINNTFFQNLFNKLINTGTYGKIVDT